MVLFHVFDSVLRSAPQPKSRFGVGAIVTAVVHGVGVGLVVWLSSRPVEEESKDVDVKFFAAAPAPAPAAAPPPAPAAESTPPRVEKKVERRPKKPLEIIPPKEIPQEKPKEAEPEPEPEPDPEPPQPGAMPGGVEGGLEGGKVGGVVGGSVGGEVGGTGSATDVVAFGEGMTRPENIKRPPDFQCPREAREAHIEGVLLASCTVTLEGNLRDCKIIKPLPHLEAVALDLLARWRVGPVFFQGRPVMVNYKIPIRMVCK